ncbi:putative oligoketide cyclase/lipid transport protein [Halorhodospira halochloris]|uniref:Oligoketide cyclase/lipid transport protein n=1 Tax=Halorhodospira halochloris TaxID=1052 RepID=A0A0X8X8D3_HALHR|nr:type II toxin-antitoxin system RatA family toxin [Halorhodospira halochloris]MBK1651163.1 ubiquinone-binding protein [Halorhodospira halochloris]MCG5547693.1 type II toxin-antitoxin system RatA family toxin [Halorhodospira halochloris]BAU57434.1 putative oligoketide cyclase/lipid transport protein [Halorhodospira halochloris]
MPTISRSAVVPYTTEEIYDLVNDVASYPEFIPWCKRCEIISTSEHSTRARMTFAKSGVEKSLVTENTHERGKSIDLRLVDGPFRHLRGHWRFYDLGDGNSKVTLEMDFEFSNRLVAYAFGKFFTQLSGRLVDAFVQRAQEIYGKRHG